MTRDSNAASLQDMKAACRTCSLYRLCLPVGIGEPELDILDRVVQRRRPIQRGRALFDIGDPFQSFFAVRSGSVRTHTLLPDGSERVTGFHLPGELVGLDGLASGQHQCAAVALETATVCEIPYARFEELWREAPALPRQMMRILSNEINNDQLLLMQVGKKAAEERLAAFLLGLSQRFARRGFSAVEFNLSMSRADIGDYLGLAEETVSRLFSRFEEQGVLAVVKKHIRIRDSAKLRELACCVGRESAEVIALPAR